MTEALLLEIFSSLQGEGVLVGCRQVFVRMAGCNLACAYCDTPFEPQPTCQLEQQPGAGTFAPIPNPVTLETLINVLQSWQQILPHHSLSLTGGEPLLQAEVLQQWLPTLTNYLPIYLETNGTLPESLEPLLPSLSWISMDVKLASVAGTATPWALHLEFLRLAARTNCQVKAVVADDTPQIELLDVAALMAEIAPHVPLILQPVTRQGRSHDAMALLKLQAAASRVHAPTRVIPQVHRFLDVL